MIILIFLILSVSKNISIEISNKKIRYLATETHKLYKKEKEKERQTDFAHIDANRNFHSLNHQHHRLHHNKRDDGVRKVNEVVH